MPPCGWVRRTWSERGPVCWRLLGCIEMADGTWSHNLRCPLHDEVECGSCPTHEPEDVSERIDTGADLFRAEGALYRTPGGDQL